MQRLAIGVDFGTLSARALLIDENGRELAQRTMDYPHGVMDRALPTGEPLGADWALQDPQDYIDCLAAVVSGVLADAGVPGEAVAGIGIDFTSCSVLPVKADGTPLCRLPEFAREPHAYVKLWKHHAAQYCADELNGLAAARGEDWLPLYGGRISSEWVLPKVMQIVREAPAVYDAMDRFIEAGDWVVWQLCGREARSACNAGYKAQWRAGKGYPSSDFLRTLDPRLERLVEEKLTDDIHPVGARAGFVTPEFAARCGLAPSTAVAVEIIDAHASVPGCGIAEPGRMLLAMGTSTCQMLLSERELSVPGSCGIVKDGILPGLYAYEAGQSCVGDHFSWFLENCLPAAYRDEAAARGVGLHVLLREKAERLRPGESGLVALDWWNGVRSVLMDFDLSGLIVGMTLQTKPEEIYRALIEATAYGTRRIIEAFETAGVPVVSLVAGGGIARKDPMAMQIYADVCGKEIAISDSSQSGALGAAILGLAAADESADVTAIVRRVGRVSDRVYRPIHENRKVYNKLYEEYIQLHDWFGKENGMMRRLKQIKRDAAAQPGIE